MKTRILASCCLALSTVACGGSAGTSVNGNLRGSPLPVSDVISANVNVSSNGGNVQGGAIVLSTMSNLCADATSNQVTKSSRSLIIFVADYNSSTNATSAPAAPGAYTAFNSSTSSGAIPAKFAVVSYSPLDASCTITAQATSSVSGTVTLTSVGGGSYAGSFDVTMDDGDHITGSFNAPNCPGLQAGIGSSTATCN